MAKYLARQIKMGKLDYDEVVTKYPQFKDEIDKILGKWYTVFAERLANDTHFRRGCSLPTIPPKNKGINIK